MPAWSVTDVAAPVVGLVSGALYSRLLLLCAFNVTVAVASLLPLPSYRPSNSWVLGTLGATITASVLTAAWVADRALDVRNEKSIAMLAAKLIRSAPVKSAELTSPSDVTHVGLAVGTAASDTLDSSSTASSANTDSDTSRDDTHDRAHIAGDERGGR